MSRSSTSELPAGDVGIVALDTETNGLYEDDGARVAVVSLAWWRGGVDTGREEDIEAVALPFAQGRVGKTELDEQPMLWDEEDPNLSRGAWQDLLDWLLGRPITMHNAQADGRIAVWLLASEVTSALSGTSTTESAKSASGRTTKLDALIGTYETAQTEHGFALKCWLTMEDAATVAERTGANTWYSTMLKAEVRSIGRSFTRLAVVEVTSPTSGPETTGTRPSSRSSAQTATWPKNGPEGAALTIWFPRPLVCHNGKFDLHKMRVGTIGRFGEPGWAGRDLSGQLVWDSQIAAKELWPGESTALKPTAARLWGQDQTEEQRALKPYLGPKTNPRFDLVPWNVIEAYAAKDAAQTLRLTSQQWREIEEGAGVGHWIRRELDVMNVLYRMEWRGLPYDAAASLDVAQELKKRQDKIGRKLPFRATDNEAKKYFFGKGEVVKGSERAQCLDLVPYATTDKGAPSLTAEITARMAQDFEEWTAAGKTARAWADWNKIATAVKMWYLPYAEGIGQDGRLRTCFRQVASGRGGEGGTRSGRFSVERVNLQAIPQDYRLSGYEILEGVPTPRQIIGQAGQKLPGWNLWELDLAQAELRVAAMWAGCAPMLSAITEERDLHGETTEALFGIKKGEADWAKYRQIGKRGNFTLCFGAGWVTFQRMVAKEAGIRLEDREAQRIVADWNGLYPEFRRAIDKYSRIADRLGHVTLANGKRRYFATGEETHKAFNQVVQASLAELGKDWAVASEEYLRLRWKLDLRGQHDGIGRGGLLLLIHDSQVLLLPEAEEEKIAQNVRVLGLDVWKRMFPEVPGDIDCKRW